MTKIDNYRILSEIGEDYYLVFDEENNKVWTLKEIVYSNNLEIKKAIISLYERLSIIENANIQHVRDIIYRSDKMDVFLDYPSGTTIRSIIHERGALTAEEVLSVGSQCCNALITLHSLVPPVYYLLNPDNIMLQEDSNIVLTCTDLYSFPELQKYQVESNNTKGISQGWDEREGVLHLGMIMYSLLSGRIVEDEGELQKMADKNPTSMAVMIDKCCNPNPIERYQSFRELERDCFSPESNFNVCLYGPPRGRLIKIARRLFH